MEDFRLFILPDCPYCRRVLAWQEELLAAQPLYRPLAPRIVDESRQKELTQGFDYYGFDYYYVPCYFLDGEKLAEGVLSREQVEEVFRRARAALYPGVPAPSVPGKKS